MYTGQERGQNTFEMKGGNTFVGGGKYKQHEDINDRKGKSK